MDKIALVTGANRGLGRGFVGFLSNRGYLVFAGARTLGEHEQNSESVRWMELDVTDDSAIDRNVAEIRMQAGRIDVLINNAGMNKDSATGGHKELVCKLESLEREPLRRLFEVNAISPLMMVKACVPLMVERGGFVINVSSDRASFHDEHDNLTGNYGYRASKIALNMFTFASTWDLPANVRTFAVHPGDVRSDMNPVGVDEPLRQAELIMAITENWQDAFHGKFMRYSGEEYKL